MAYRLHANVLIVPMVAVAACTWSRPAVSPAESLVVSRVETKAVVGMAGPRDVPNRVPSPDGRLLVYAEPAERGVESTTYRLAVARAGGGGEDEIARIANYSGAAWSPDSTKVAYSEGALVHVADADGKTSVTLYGGPGGPYPGACFDLRWSPDGQQLSFLQVESVQYEELAHPVRVTLTLERNVQQ